MSQNKGEGVVFGNSCFLAEGRGNETFPYQRIFGGWGSNFGLTGQFPWNSVSLLLHTISIMFASSASAFWRGPTWFKRLHSFLSSPYIFRSKPCRKFITILGWSAASCGVSQFVSLHSNNTNWIGQTHFFHNNITGRNLTSTRSKLHSKRLGQSSRRCSYRWCGPFSPSSFAKPISTKASRRI